MYKIRRRKVDPYFTILKSQLKMDQRPKCKTKNNTPIRKKPHHNMGVNNKLLDSTFQAQEQEMKVHAWETH